MRTLNNLKLMTLHEFRAIMRNKIAFFFNLAIPVVLVVIFGSMWGNGESGSDVLDFMMAGQLVYMLLSAGLMTVAIALASQRQNGSLRHLFTTPLSMGVWFGAQMLANIAMATLQIVVIFVVGHLLFGVHAPLNIPATAVVLFISSLACLSMGLAIGALVKSAEAAFPISMILFFSIAMFGNVMMPIDGAPPFILAVQKWMPSYFMTEALGKVMMRGEGLLNAAGEVSMLLGLMVVCGSVAIWRIRKQMTVA
ncbi:MAG: transporter permease protein [Symbiobacteriaceae bacterium]|jgi:ABC-2 type transport system permease protein|nr:transporter permease protein [Symbiobacteriaceae bacterium]